MMNDSKEFIRTVLAIYLSVIGPYIIVFHPETELYSNFVTFLIGWIFGCLVLELVGVYWYYVKAYFSNFVLKNS